MFNPQDLPDTLPVFPLPGALLLPRARLPLHIFEPRYLAMLDDILKTPERLIGMIQPVSGPDGPEMLHSVGCAGRLTSFSETEDGRYMITLTGISRFRISTEVEGLSFYRQCEVDWHDFETDFGPVEHDPDFRRDPFMALLARFFETQDLKIDWEPLRDAEDEMLINSLAMLCPFAPEDRQALLEAPTLTDRRKVLTTLLEFALFGGQNDKVMQ